MNGKGGTSKGERVVEPVQSSFTPIMQVLIHPEW